MNPTEPERSPLKVTVVGLGAVGGLIAGRLARAGNDVSSVARGDTLNAVRRHGLRVIEPVPNSAETVTYLAPVRAVPDAGELGPQDLVVVAVKATALKDIVGAMSHLMGPHTVILSAMNGVPWWFFSGHPGPLRGTCLSTVDPGGILSAHMPAERVLGGVVMWSSSCPFPGVVRLGLGNRLTLGEAMGGMSGTVERLAAILTRAGFEIAKSSDVRKDAWYKLWGNMTANPVSAMTGATYDRMLADPLVMRFIYDCMEEASTIGAKIGCAIDQSGEDLMVTAGRSLGPFKTSMLQDVEAGRQIELDALLAAVREIGVLVGVPTPRIDALFGLSRLHGRMHGIYPDEG